MQNISEKLLSYLETFRKMRDELNQFKGQKFLIKGSTIGSDMKEELITIDSIDLSENCICFTYYDLLEKEELWDAISIKKFVNNIITMLDAKV